MEISFDNLNFNNGIVLSTSDNQFEIYYPPQDQNQRMLALYKDKGVSTDFNITDYFSGNADYGRIGVKISDGDTGKLLWKYEKEINKKTNIPS